MPSLHGLTGIWTAIARCSNTKHGPKPQHKIARFWTGAFLLACFMSLFF